MSETEVVPCIIILYIVAGCQSKGHSLMPFCYWLGTICSRIPMTTVDLATGLKQAALSRA